MSEWVQQKPQSPTVTTATQTLTLTNESHPLAPTLAGCLETGWWRGKLCKALQTQAVTTFEHNPFDSDGNGQGEANHNEQLSSHPCAALSMDHPSHIYKVQEGFVPCAAPTCFIPSSPPGALLVSLTLGKAQHGQQAQIVMLSCSRSPLCNRHRHNLYLNMNGFMVTQRLKAMPCT